MTQITDYNYGPVEMLGFLKGESEFTVITFTKQKDVILK